MCRMVNVLFMLSPFLMGNCSVPFEVNVDAEESVVIFRGSPCRKPSEAGLRAQLGVHLDEKRMSMTSHVGSRLLSSLQPQNPASRRSRRHRRRKRMRKHRRVPRDVWDSRHLEETPVGLTEDSTNFITGRYGRYRSHSRPMVHKKPSVRTEDTGDKRLPWQCTMEQQWKRMPKGTFPHYIQTGQCKQTTCMLDTYSCSPVNYALKVLKRNPTSCDPIPTIGNKTIYEERWEFSEIKVTVFCECARLRSAFRTGSTTPTYYD